MGRSKKERLRARNDAIKKRQANGKSKPKHRAEDERHEPATIQELRDMRVAVAKCNTDLCQWKRHMLLGEDVVQTEAGWFIGHNSAILNSLLKRKTSRLNDLQARLRRETSRRESAMSPPPRPKAPPRRKQRNHTVVKRMCAGTLLIKNERGDPQYVRCYHTRNQIGMNVVVDCDCTVQNDQYVLSDESELMRKANALIVDNSTLNKQRDALRDVAIGAFIPNAYIPVRGFELEVLKRLAARPDIGDRALAYYAGAPGVG